MSLKRYRTETNCQNCGAEVKGKFCSNCGQENIEVHENFFQVAVEYVSESFSFDSKVLRSLIPLVTKPGFLTQEYWDGKRIRYIHPLRIFFYVTVVFALSTTYLYEIHGGKLKDSMVFGDKNMAKIDSAYLANLPDTAKVMIPGLNQSYTAAEIKEAKTRDARMLRKLRQSVDLVFINLKYVTFFMLPVYALIFKMFYRKRRKFYVDHLIYTIHLQTFVFCLVSVLMLLIYLYPPSVEIIIRTTFPAIAGYIALSLHYLYREKLWKTIVVSLAITGILLLMTLLGIFIPVLIDAMFFQS